MLETGCVRRKRDQAERFDQPGEAADYYVLKRAPDGRTIPVERYFVARAAMLRMPVYSSRARRFLGRGKIDRRLALASAWTELGPGNVGGRTRALVVSPADPRVMYAGGVAGGVWKTEDAGESWRPLADLMSNLAVSSLAMDPRNPDVLYAGTGEGYGNVDAVRGGGIFVTRDAGSTWARLEQTAVPGFYYVNDIVVSPADSNRVYAATNSGIWRSLDAGETWSRVVNQDFPRAGCQDLVIRTDLGSDFLFAACGTRTSTAVILRTRDGAAGDPWEAVFTTPDMSRTSLALAPSDQSIIYALASSYETGDRRHGLLGVYRSTSNGDAGSWETRVGNTDANRLNTALLSNPRELFADICSSGESRILNQGWYDIVVAVDPVNPQRVWAGGVDLFRSDDGGSTWGLVTYWWSAGDKRTHADHHALVFHPGYNGTSNQVLFDTNDGGIYRADNAASGVSAGPRAACSTAESQVTWTSLNNGYAVTQFYHGAPYPGGHIYLGGTQDNGTQLGTDDWGSQQWLRAFSGDGGYVAIDPAGANTIFLETTNLSLRKSTDGGISFRTVTRGIREPGANFLFIAPFQMDPNDSKTMLIGGRTLWRTRDGAENWEAASAAIPEGNISMMAAAPGNPDRVVFGTSRGSIHLSDAALSATEETVWQSSRPRAGFVSWLAFDPANADIVYATYSTFNSGLDRGHVFRSVDGGRSWTPLEGSGDSRLPDIPVHSIVIDPRDSSTLYIGTDLGVFVSLDSGETWAREESGFPNTVVESLVLDPGGSLFAFTHGRGAFRVRLTGTASCDYRVSPTEMSIPADGIGTPLRIEAPPGCRWSIVTNVGWIVPQPASGEGPGEFRLQTAPNNGGVERSGALSAAGITVKVTQTAR
jgi:photosystem II stability/assembly factor-like uncharacterized protein